MGRKLLCARAIGPSLLKYRYSGSLVATDRMRLSLLCLLVATDMLMPFVHATRVHSSDGRDDISSPVNAGYKTQSAFNL
jgi:hypothetical protein